MYHLQIKQKKRSRLYVSKWQDLQKVLETFKEQNEAASESGIPAFVAGLQGIVAAAQLVTGTLAMFGIENEKLEKSMVQLIGVAQGTCDRRRHLCKGQVSSNAHNLLRTRRQRQQMQWQQKVKALGNNWSD